MYAFSVALAMNKIATELKPPGQTHYIAQVGGWAGQFRSTRPGLPGGSGAVA